MTLCSREPATFELTYLVRSGKEWLTRGELQLSLVSSRVLPERALSVQHTTRAVRQLRGDLAVRQAVMLAFQDPLPEQCSLLREITERKWRDLARWLDLSGLALYFFDRVNELGWQAL